MTLSADRNAGCRSVTCGPELGSSPSGHLVGTESDPLLIPVGKLNPSCRWAPLSKKEVAQVAEGPGWRKLHFCLVLLFWVSWLSILVSVITIIALSPRPVAPSLRWWQKAPLYQEQSALLLNSDQLQMRAVGGVHDHLQYLHSLGVGALIVEDFFWQNLTPLGLLQPNSSLDTLSQLLEILTEGKKAGLRILLDLCGLDLSDFSSTNLTNETGESNSSTELHALRFLLDHGVAGFSICDTDAAYSEPMLLLWRALLKEFSEEDNERIVIVKQMVEMETKHSVSSPRVNHSLVEIITRSLFSPSLWPLSGKEVVVAIETSLLMPQEEWPSWTWGGAVPWALRRILMVLAMTLPGPPVIGYDKELSQLQMTETSALFHTLSFLRSRESALLFGDFTLLLPSSPLNSSFSDSSVAPAPPVLAFLRSWDCTRFLILLNLSRDVCRLDPSWASGLPSSGLFTASSGLDRVGLVTLDSLILKPEEAVIVKLLDSRTFSEA